MSLQTNIFISATSISCINWMPVVFHLFHYIFIFIIHFIPYILYQDPHEDETMPAWPPLILDQSNNLLVIMMIAQLINAVVMYYVPLMPYELSLQVANETSGVRRLTVPSGQTVTLYCPKTSFENYQGLWEWHWHFHPMFFYQIFNGGVYNKILFGCW